MDELTEEQKQERYENTLMFQRLDALKNSQDFNWFVKEFFAPLLNEQQAELESLTVDDATRTRAAHKVNLAKAFIGMLEKQHAFYYNAAEIAARKPQ